MGVDVRPLCGWVAAVAGVHGFHPWLLKFRHFVAYGKAARGVHIVFIYTAGQAARNVFRREHMKVKISV